MGYQYSTDYKDNNKFSFSALFSFIFCLIILFGLFFGVPYALFKYSRYLDLHDCEITLNDGTKKIYRTYDSYSINGFYCVRKDMDIKYIAPYEYIKIPLTNIKNIDIHYINK